MYLTACDANRKELGAAPSLPDKRPAEDHAALRRRKLPSAAEELPPAGLRTFREEHTPVSWSYPRPQGDCTAPLFEQGGTGP